MLTRIYARNLACFGDAGYHVDLAPETAIIGPNNVGKSAMIAAFNFLRSNPMSAGRGTQFEPVWKTSTYNWEDFRSAVHRHDTDRTIGVGASLKSVYGYIAEISTEISRAGGNTKVTGSFPERDLRREFAGIWYLRASRMELPPKMQVRNTSPYEKWEQPIEVDGSNAITYLLERYTSRDPRWEVAENWLKRIIPDLSVLKSPLRGDLASMETTDSGFAVDVNVAYQGTGIQKVLSTIAAVVFSPEGSTIIVEEPEIHLHPSSQEVLVDLFNLAVNDWKKQVIFTTHSFNMLLPFASDIGTGSPRGEPHIAAKPENFKLIAFKRVGDNIQIEEYPMKGKEFMYLRQYLKDLWG